jgi:hypothetical protein
MQQDIHTDTDESVEEEGYKRVVDHLAGCLTYDAAMSGNVIS